MDILVDSLSFTYPSGIQALQDVSLHIRSGECVAIIGQNGAGKTTLVKHFNGLLKPTAGQVRVGDWDTRQVPTSRLASRVGLAFQNPDDQLFSSTVWNEILFGPKNLGWPWERIEQRARETLEWVGLSEFTQKHPYDLPPNLRRRLALAAVLVMDTPILILDEPTTGQDYAGTELIGQLVDHLSAQGKTVITIAHDIDFCAEHFQRVVVMSQGRILLDGPARYVLSQTEVIAQAYVEAPQIMRLASALGMAKMPLNVNEFVRFWCSGSEAAE